MTPRMRVIAGPNGSGKSTLARQLMTDYEVNLYTFLNADDLFREIQARLKTPCPFSTDPAELLSFVEQSTYPDQFKAFFRTGKISINEADYIVFSPDAVNSYTVALLVNFLQDECIKRGISFSQETVFSHPSKVAALEKAAAAGFRTYLYFVATDSPAINAERVAERYAQGGHDVPPEKIAARYARSLANLPAAMPHVWRAFFFDNSGAEMRYVACYSKDSGLEIQVPDQELPRWLAAASQRNGL